MIEQFYLTRRLDLTAIIDLGQGGPGSNGKDPRLESQHQIFLCHTTTFVAGGGLTPSAEMQSAYFTAPVD